MQDLLGDTSSKQLLLRMSYSSLEAVGNGDWRLGLRKQVPHIPHYFLFDYTVSHGYNFIALSTFDGLF